MLVDLQKCAAAKIRQPVVNADTEREVELPHWLREELRKSVDGALAVGPFTSLIERRSGVVSSIIPVPNQYFRIAAAVHDFALELFKYLQALDELRPQNALLTGTAAEIQDKLTHADPPVKLTPDDIMLFARFMSTDQGEGRLGAKRPINDTGNIRSSDDCFGSVVLTQVNVPNASASILGDIIYDLSRNDAVYRKLVDFYDGIDVSSTIESGAGIPLPKPFVLLAGISGTGKTRYVKTQSTRTGNGLENHLLVSVRPDWHEPSDLLGYVSRIGTLHFVVTPLLSFMASAWRAASVVIGDDAYEMERPSETVTYWACLDEMNLAPVEQYFADYLSVLETRTIVGNRYRCAPIIDIAKLNLDAAALERLRTELGFEEGAVLWNHFVVHGMPLPPNLVLAGTVNMDETAHGFSRKVIDRAFTIDFGEFFPNVFGEYFNQTRSPVTLTFPRWSSVVEADLAIVRADSHGKRSIEFLEGINTVLVNTPFSLAYRALNELLVAVRSFAPADDAMLAAVWDDFLMTKVLPRLEGDAEKLNFEGGKKSLLTKLRDKVEECLFALLPGGDESTATRKRPDLLQSPADPDGVELRSLKALSRMQARLERHNFTSFWP